VSLRTLHLLGSPVLRERSAEVAVLDDEVKALIADLIETMRFCKGVGLAANQVGIARRVAVVEAEQGQVQVLVNPVLVSRAGAEKAEEGCLSIPDLYGDVERAATIVVEALDEQGEPRRIEAGGLLARAIQHEIDHLDGILFLDRLGPFKRRFLLRQWEKARKGKPGYLKELVAEDAART
jgi:peptide deformylase